MTKRLLIIILSMAMTCVAPFSMAAQEQEVNITYTSGVLYVTGGEGCTLEVVSLTGKSVMTVTIDSPAQKIELNIPKGCYIVKVGKTVRKVAVR